MPNRRALKAIVAALVCQLFLTSSTSPPTVIAFPRASGEALIIPAESPLRFRRWDEYGYAEFEGRIVLTGKFTYGCWACADYAGPVTNEDLEFRVESDPQLARLLPHWKIRQQTPIILISGAEGLVAAVTSKQTRKALLAGRIQSVEGRLSVTVDRLRTGIECDSANYSARFVSLAERPKLAQVKFEGDYGCA